MLGSAYSAAHTLNLISSVKATDTFNETALDTVKKKVWEKLYYFKEVIFMYTLNFYSKRKERQKTNKQTSGYNSCKLFSNFHI